MKLIPEFLTENCLLDRAFFVVPRFAAVICGFWPQLAPSKFDIVRFFVSSTFIGIGAFGENLYGCMYLGELTKALEAFCPGITKVISLLKMYVFFIYRKDLYSIVKQMRDMVFCEKDPEKIRILAKHTSISSVVSFVLLLSGSITNLSFSIRPLIVNLFRFINGQQVLPDLPFNIILPQVLLKYPLYPVTFISLTISGAMTVFTFSAVDGFFMCACMYICGLFRVLQYDIRDIFKDLEYEDVASPASNVVFRSKLALIVKRHNEIIDLCSHFTARFTLIILMHFLSAAFVLCLSILDLLLNSASIAFLIYACYSVAAVTQLFIYCMGGNYVSESSLEVADTMYFMPWYKCDVPTRKMILIILRRAQRAKTIAVPFFTPSLPAFRTIISTAGSYIALLKTFL